MTEDELEILEEFVQESREHLAAIEPDLLEMERLGSGTSSEIVNRVFRAIHSTKGGAAFLAFESLKDFSHVMENVLMLIRDGKLCISSDVIDALLRGVDVLRRMVDDIRTSDKIDCSAERQLLDAVLGVTSAHSSPAAPVASAPLIQERTVEPRQEPNLVTVTKKQTEDSGTSKEKGKAATPTQDWDALMRDLLAHGQMLYRIVARARMDLAASRVTEEEIESRAGSVGRVLRKQLLATPSAADGDGDPTFEWQVASVLDRKLLATALGIPERCISLASRGAVDENVNKPPAGAQPGPVARETPGPGIVGSLPVDAAAVGMLKSPTAHLTPSMPAAAKDKLVPSSGQKEASAEASETLRVRVELLNRLMDSASELVLGRNQLLRALKEQADKSAGLGIILQHIDRVTTDLQEGIMQTRMQQIGSLFGRFARVARDLGRQLGKNVELRAEGNHVELDKSIIEALVDPLTHIVRNAVDHAIETPEERRRRNKPEVGKILLNASHESGQVKIIVEDDGRGIDRARVLRKAIEKGLITASAAEKATDRDVVNLIMSPGFSTADQISDVSGRGVGMDVVRNNVEALGGQIEIDSELGLGTSVQLRLPLTLAIIPSLIVGAGGARFAVPQASIVELVWVRAGDVRERIQCLQGSLMLRLRERLVPLVKVDDVLGRTTHTPNSSGMADSQDHYILLLRTGTDQYGLIVDELFESEEIVVKPLPHFLKGIECFAGTTILGDGSVTMILDPSGVAARAGLRFAASGVTEVGTSTVGRQVSASKRSVILFAGSPEEQFIVPQEQVLRLERVTKADLHRSGGKNYVCYRGVGLPLVRLEDVLPVGGVPEFADEVFLLIPRMARGRATEPSAGILVWRILDALDLDLALQAALFNGPGVRGATLLDGILTTFIDPVALIEAAHPNKERAA
jgi:two-component system chemotaxis sensor kinase CheA